MVLGLLVGLLAGCVVMAISAIASRTVWDGNAERRRSVIGTTDAVTFGLFMAGVVVMAFERGTGAFIAMMVGGAVVVGVVAVVDPRWTRLWSGPAGASETLG